MATQTPATKPPVFEDKTLICSDCNEPFDWCAGEQHYYWKRGLSQPRRCYDCRERRRDAIQNGR